MRTLTTVLVLSLCWPARASLAATRAFAETYETRTGSEGDAQVETWVDDDDSFGNWDVWRIWWGGTASVTDALEVSIYGIAAQQRGGSATVAGESSAFALEMIYFDGRYRFLGSGGEGFSAMIELSYCLPTLPGVVDQEVLNYLDHSNAIGEKLIASYQRGRFLSAANLQLAEVITLNQDTTDPGVSYGVKLALKYSAGVAWSVLKPGSRGPPFTLGVEAFGDFPFARGTWALFWPGGFPVAVGPAVSFASGRFWATASWGYAPGGGAVLPPVGKALFYGTEGVGRLIAAFEF